MSPTLGWAAPRPISARSIPARLGARCCAPGCGDKIKPEPGEAMHEITWSDGTVSYVERGCVDWFICGHPDHGGGHGPVPGL